MAALSRLDLGPNLRAWLGPEAFSSLLAVHPHVGIGLGPGGLGAPAGGPTGLTGIFVAFMPKGRRADSTEGADPRSRSPGWWTMHVWRTALVLGLVALGCRTPVVPPDVSAPDSSTLNTSLQPIDVRYGLDVNDVELAILLAVANPPDPPALAAGQTITDDVLAKIVGTSPGIRRPNHPWTFESRQPGLVYAGYEREPVSMRVAIRFDDQLVMLRIVESRNLGQNGDFIRGEAFDRLSELDERIREIVITVAQRNQYGVPVPASH
jgi:hypothetical protein